MTGNTLHRTLVGPFVVAMLVAPAGTRAQDPATLRPPRPIPGITVDDPFPRGCVDCHVVLPDGMDVRISTLMGHWTEGVDSLLLRVAQGTAPAGMTLSGRHPTVTAALRDIPAGCLTCHARTSTMAPPFARLLHRIHLSGGESSVFLTEFQGECTYCHKLDHATGGWSVPSSAER